MSWEHSCTQSNTFKVKNPNEVKEVLEKLGLEVYTNNENEITFYGGDNGEQFDENAEVVFSIKPREIDGTVKNLFGLMSGFICDEVDIDELKEEYNITDEDIMITPIVEYIQDQLVDERQYIVITTVGYTGRMSGNIDPYGGIEVITKNSHTGNNLYGVGNLLLQEQGFKV